MRRQSGDSSIDLRDYDSRNAQSPASDYDNAGILRSRNHNVPAYPYVHGTGQAQVMSRSTPASHLGTNDDYVLDIALLNDSLAIRHAGICVQQHPLSMHLFIVVVHSVYFPIFSEALAPNIDNYRMVWIGHF
uniref:Uncharacterized protein n=1 Tax=Parascaris equorum TaxID=6256 RepID=A0A914RWE8_PAREQ